MDWQDNKTVWVTLGIGVLVALIFGVAKVYKSGGDNNSNSQTGQEVDITIDEDEWSKGPEDAPVTLVEYGDFQCPACKSYQPIVSRIQQKYSDKVRLVFRNLPLVQIHENALVAARAAEAAGAQDEFWEMHDKLYENQTEWNNNPNPKQIFKQYAGDIGLDTEQFMNDIDSDKIEEKVRADMRTAGEFNLSGTPSFIINGKKLNQAPRSLQEFDQLIQENLNNPRASNNSNTSTKQKTVHKHADLAIYANNRKIDLSKEKFQSSEDDRKHKHSHHHDNVGNIIHQHKSGITLGEHFESLGMKFTDECLKLANGQEYCSNENNSLKLFVNGERNTQYGDYVFEDLDRILISYGPKLDSNNIEWQLKQVTDKSCIYSGKCPERGEPPEESCVGGLGTKCETSSEDTNKNSTSSEENS